MYEETVERIAHMMAEDNGDPQHWGVYATRAMEIVGLLGLKKYRSSDYINSDGTLAVRSR